MSKNSSSSLTRKARFDSFRLFVEAVAEKCGGNAQERYAWYGGTREELLEFVKHGFSHCGKPVHGQSYGVGVHLASAKYPMEE